LDFNLRRLGLNNSSKILSITHAHCLDGTVSQMVIEAVFKNVTSMAFNYEEIDGMLDSFINGVYYNNYDFIILTDISPKDPEILKGKNKIILLDHHAPKMYHHNPAENKYVIPDLFSGSSLTKKFCEEYFGTKINHLNDVVYLSQDYDLFHKCNCKSTFMNELHWMYHPEKFKKRFYGGDTRLNPDEIKYLRKRKREFKTTFDNLEIYDLHKIGGCYVESSNFLNEICEKLLKDKYNIVFCRNNSPRKTSISVRCRKGFVDIGKILEELGYGGGHPQAGGMSEPDFKILMDKILKIEERILLELKRKK
jgi:oligoribonuclease NrnB/cAMP/cGMP phosphodiesterase (DHH superfamily)